MTGIRRKYLSLKEAAEYTGISVSELHRNIKKGKLHAYRPSQRLIRVSLLDLEEFMNKKYRRRGIE